MNMETLFVSFSGGRTSAYMAKWLLDNKSNEFNFIFLFANTGLEHEKTLEFVNKCDKAWGLNIVWLECVVNPKVGKGSDYKIVTFETASRNGEPFESVIRKYGIANKDFPHCNREMKLAPIGKYAKETTGDFKMAIGIRLDELDRINENYKSRGLVYPLAFWQPTTKEMIRHWWSDQEFDLEIPEHYGNCVTCWKKSDRKLMTIAKHEPERFEFMRRMEVEHSFSGAATYDESGNRTPRKWFRKYRTVSDIIASSKKPFVEFVDHMPELQYGLFDEIDKSNGCSESCDIYSD